MYKHSEKVIKETINVMSENDKKIVKELLSVNSAQGSVALYRSPLFLPLLAEHPDSKILNRKKGTWTKFYETKRIEIYCSNPLLQEHADILAFLIPKARPTESKKYKGAIVCSVKTSLREIAEFLGYKNSAKATHRVEKRIKELVIPKFAYRRKEKEFRTFDCIIDFYYNEKEKTTYFEIDPFFVILFFMIDKAIDYSHFLTEIVSMNSAFSKAIVRYCYTHSKTIHENLWNIITKISGIECLPSEKDGERKKRKLRKIRYNIKKELKKDIEKIKKVGVEIDFDKNIVHYNPKSEIVKDKVKIYYHAAARQQKAIGVIEKYTEVQK